MKKIVLIVLSFFMSASVFAGQYEDALRTGQPVFLYAYTKQCKYCKEFNPVFEKAVQSHKNSFKFVKVDAETPYGTLLMRDLRASYVPFVIMADAKRKYMISIEPDCLIDSACLDKEMRNFLK